MSQAGLPTPEEMLGLLQDTAEDRTRITLTVREAVMVLGLMATLNVNMVTCDEPDCIHCNAFNTLFWEISNALPLAARVRYQRGLREAGVELPPAPWEVVSQG